MKMLQMRKSIIVFLVAQILFLACFAFALHCGFRYGLTTGESMKPAFGSVNLVFGHVPASFSELKEGDIITFCFQNVSVCHRIIGFWDDKIFTMGDNNFEGATSWGECVRFEDVFFVVDWYVPVW